MTFNQIEEELNKPAFKFWHLQDYDDPKKEKELMGEIPNLDDYLRKKTQIQKELLKVTPELRQFYCEPLLSREQEQHLFRKFNFMKYKAKKYYNWYKLSKTKKLKSIITSHMLEVNRIRNWIVCCNTRLASLIIKKRKDFYNGNIDDLLSDCFYNIMKAVDGFDFSRKNAQGQHNKFSTYCTWVLMNNSLRDHSADKKFYDKVSSNLEESVFGEKIDEKNSNSCHEYEHKESLQSDVKKILDCLKEKFPREMYIIKSYFSIDQDSKMTLKDISKKMNLTKERVRQLRENAIKHIQMLVSTGELKLSSDISL